MSIDKHWYWDWRTNKALYPIATDEDTVTLVTVWHRDEVESAIETDALEDVESVGGNNQGFDHFDTFRLPDEDELRATIGAE
jgi:hypothetical protein